MVKRNKNHPKFYQRVQLSEFPGNDPQDTLYRCYFCHDELVIYLVCKLSSDISLSHLLLPLNVAMEWEAARVCHSTWAHVANQIINLCLGNVLHYLFDLSLNDSYIDNLWITPSYLSMSILVNGSHFYWLGCLLFQKT